MNKFSSLDTPMLVTLNDNSGKTLKTLITNDALKQTLSGYAVPQKEFFTFSNHRWREVERLDDETG